MDARAYFVIALAYLVCCNAVPDGFILNVNPTCGDTKTNETKVEIAADMDPFKAVLVCKGHKEYEMLRNDFYIYSGTVVVNGDENAECVFQSSSSDVYTVLVKLSYSTVIGSSFTSQEYYKITCVYSVRQQSASPNAEVAESESAPVEIHHHAGGTAKSTFTLDLVNMLGGNLGNTNVDLGRKVRLKAVMEGNDVLEQGLMPVTCTAIASTYRYQILRGGCGDGLVIKKNQGFITTKKMVFSPYFSAFRLGDSSTIKFECTFTTCAKVCNGNSCHFARGGARTRREVFGKQDKDFTISSLPIRLKRQTGPGLDSKEEESKGEPHMSKTENSGDSDEKEKQESHLVRSEIKPVFDKEDESKSKPPSTDSQTVVSVFKLLTIVFFALIVLLLIWLCIPEMKRLWVKFHQPQSQSSRPGSWQIWTSEIPHIRMK